MSDFKEVLEKLSYEDIKRIDGIYRANESDKYKFKAYKVPGDIIRIDFKLIIK